MISKLFLEAISSIHQNQAAHISTTLNFFVDNFKSVCSQYLTLLSLWLKKCFSKRFEPWRFRNEKIRKWKDSLQLCMQKELEYESMCNILIRFCHQLQLHLNSSLKFFSLFDSSQTLHLHRIFILFLEWIKYCSSS